MHVGRNVCVSGTDPSRRTPRSATQAVMGGQETTHDRLCVGNGRRVVPLGDKLPMVCEIALFTRGTKCLFVGDPVPLCGCGADKLAVVDAEAMGAANYAVAVEAGNRRVRVVPSHSKRGVFVGRQFRTGGGARKRPPEAVSIAGSELSSSLTVVDRVHSGLRWVGADASFK